MLESIQKNVTWRAIPIAGISAGTIFLLVNLVLTPIVMEVDPAIILRYMASLILGSDVLMESNSADIIIVGLIVNYGISLVGAFVIAVVIHRWGLLIGIVIGAILGLAIYGINLYTLTFFFDLDWFIAINSLVFMISHVVFGAVAGGVYELFDHYDVPFELGGNHE